MSETYVLDKAVLTEEDFGKTIRCIPNIHAMCFQQDRNNWTGNFVLDIDFIFKAVDPIPPGENFSYWISPCTLIFHETSEFRMDYDTTQYSFGLLNVEEIIINKINESYNVAIELWGGTINFNCSKGFSVIVRKMPVCIHNIELSMEERGGISFGTKPYK